MKEFKSLLKDKNILIYIIHSALYGLLFVYPIFSIFLLSKKGISNTELTIYFSCFMILQALFEIPTGYFADKFKRKYSIAVGFFLLAIGHLILIPANNLWTLLIAALILAIGNTFRSGAIDSLFYDYLKSIGKEKSYANISGKISSIILITGIIATSTGAYLYTLNKNIPFILIGIFYTIAGILILFFNEKGNFHSPELKIFTGFKILFSKKLLYLTSLNLLIMPLLVTFYNIYNYPFINKLGLSPKYIGIYDAFMALFLAIAMGTLIAKITKLKFSKEIFTLTAIIVFGFYLANSNLPLALILNFIIAISFSLRIKIIYNQLNQKIESASRATTLSTMSFLETLVGGIFMNVIVRIIEKF